MCKVIPRDRLHGRLRLRNGVLHRVVRRQPYELYAFKNRAFGPYWWAYWA